MVIKMILTDLIANELNESELHPELKIPQSKVRLAVEAMLSDAKKAALGEGEYLTYDEIFNTED